jgi:hypothetical protein
MFHELWHSTSLSWHPDSFLQFVHRRYLLRLTKHADRVFASTEGYRKTLIKYSPSTSIVVLPVGSNIPLVQNIPFLEREPGLWALFGKQESRIRTLRNFQKWIPKLFHSSLLKRLYLVGSISSPDAASKEDELLERLLPNHAVHKCQGMSTREISAILSICRYGFFSQSPESYSKSTILMAYCAHSIQVVVPEPWPDYIPIHSYVIDPSVLLQSESDSLDVSRRAFRLAQWHNQVASWHSISGAYLSAINQLIG